MSPARQAAFRILLRVEGGAWASELLRAARLEARDARLASHIVLGSLRYQGQLDFLIQHFSGKLASRLDAAVRIALRAGIYQLRYLDRLPAHAVVADSVDLVKRAHKRSAAGLVNAVLRKVHRRPVVWPDRPTELSVPAWLLERWDRRFGEDCAACIARAFLAPPDTYLRVPPGAEPPPMAVPTDIPGCFRAPSGEAGGFRLQDIGSQAIVALLELSPGFRFLDLCAAPGNKTAQALEAGVRAVACERHWSRLAPLRGLGCPLVALDGAQPLPFPRVFDRVLVDAPCSGTGTLGRNPEIKWRVTPSDLTCLRRRQVGLLRQALGCLKPGGLLVYSTCSLEREENEEVVEEVLGRPPERVLRRIPGTDPGDGFYAAVIRSD